MTETEALNYAIFAMNTLLEPDASEDRDVEQLFEYAPAAIDVLVARRDALKKQEQALCTVQHGDWTGQHARIASCPEPGYDPHGGEKHRVYEEN